MTEQVMQTIKITDHPTHGEFNVEVPEGMEDTAVNQYVSNLDLNLLLGAGRSKMKGEEVEQFENSNKAGFKNDRWTPVTSLEGGTDTLAYGHKLTSEEVQSGIIKIGDTEVKYADGLTEEQAVALFTQDGEWAKGIAEDSLGKSGLELTPNRVESLTSLIYNVGSGSWGKSKAKQYLESGNIEDFMHEAFDPEVGFVKINGEVSRGLVRRRGEEARLFGESDIAQGGSFGTMMSDVLGKFNPISEASADILPPPQETAPQTPTQEFSGYGIPESLEAVESLVNDRQLPPAVSEPIQPNEVPTSDRIITMATARNFVEVAEETLGLHEDKTDDQSVIKSFIDNAIGSKDALGSNASEVATKQAWCSAWLYHVLTKAGVGRNKLINQMNVSDPYDFVRAHKYKKVGKPVWSTKMGKNYSSIKEGDIMIKTHTTEDIADPKNGLKGRQPGIAGHLGIVTKVVGDEVYFIAGNAGGKTVKEASYNLVEKDIVIRRATGVKNVPQDVVKDIMTEEKWGPILSPIMKLFN